MSMSVGNQPGGPWDELDISTIPTLVLTCLALPTVLGEFGIVLLCFVLG